MKIVHVLPITQGVLKDTLTYYTSKNAEKNSLVVISIRGKSVPGLVVSCEDAVEAKSRLKTAHFSLKRVERVAEKNFLLPEFLEAAEETGRYFAGTTGGVISGLVPNRIFDEYLLPKGTLSSTEHKYTRPETKTSPDNLQHTDKYVIQANDDDRFSVYRGIIRESFAKNSSVFLSSPTQSGAFSIFKEMSRGIEPYAFLLHGKMPAREMAGIWKRVLETEHPVLIVATPIYASIPRRDFGAFIVEQESRDAYQTFSRPYFDFRYFLERYAEKLNAKFIAGDFFLRTESLHRYEEKNMSSIIPMRFRLLSTIKQEVVDMKAEKTDSAPNAEFHIIGKRLEEAMRETLAARGNIFLWGVRRGLAPLTACRDCGSIFSCQRCGVPFVLHKEGGGTRLRNIFICHTCEERKASEITCTKCGSWRLQALGVGVEQSAEEVRRLFPGVTVYEMHADAVKTDKKAESIAEAFAQGSGAILVGTELAFSHVKSAELCAVTSADSLFSLPDFRIHEKILRKLLEVKLKAERTFVVQTRYPQEKLFQSLIQGNLMDFYRDEISAREQFKYPPFSVIVKIRFEGAEAEVAQKAEYIEKLFEQYRPNIFPAFIPKIKDRYQVNAIIKVPAAKWPEEDILAKLLALPPYYRVKVDPEDLL
jgi:primosomal protein N' (replication factor Y)